MGPIQTISNQYFVFELKNDDIVEEVITGDSFKSCKKNRYQISDMEKNTYNHVFNKKYVVETEKLKNILTEEVLNKIDIDSNSKELIENGVIDKWTLIKIYNYMNFELNKETENNQKQLKK